MQEYLHSQIFNNRGKSPVYLFFYFKAMNIDVARALYQSRYSNIYELEQYLQHLKEGLVLAQIRQQQVTECAETAFSSNQKEKLTLALEYNETLMLHLIITPSPPVKP